MPDSMRKDVEKLLEDIPATRKAPERFTRKEQAKQAVSGVPAGPATNAAGPSATAAVPQEDEVTTVKRLLLSGVGLLPRNTSFKTTRPESNNMALVTYVKVGCLA